MNLILTQQQVWLKVQLKAVQTQQTQQYSANVTKSKRLLNFAVFDSSQNKLKEFLLKLQVKIIKSADWFLTSQDKLWYAITQVTDKVKN